MSNIIAKPNRWLARVCNPCQNYEKIRELIFKKNENGTGHRPAPACDQDEQLIGYFPFIVIDDKLILLTFLPLSSPNVPEGKLLHQEINLEKQDLSFLNMDKLSFYRQTDFEAIPQLKMALQKSGIWHLTQLVPQLSFEEENKEKSVGIISRFFQ